MTTQKIQFDTKEQYEAFRSAWANSVNTAQSESRKSGEDFGSISPEAHIAYNIIRGKAFDTGFTPITSCNKLQNGTLINQGLHDGYHRLASIQKAARKTIEDGKERIGVKYFLETFGGTITLEMITQIQLPELKAMTPDYGQYQSIAKKIIQGKFTPTTFAQIENLLEVA